MNNDFRLLTNIRNARTAERAAASARYMVKSLNKDGSVSRSKPTANTWRFDVFSTLEAAPAAGAPRRGAPRRGGSAELG